MSKKRLLQTSTNDLSAANVKPAMKHSTLAVIALIVVTLVWGGGFPGLYFVSRIPTFHVNAIRFTGSAIILALVFRKRLKVINRDYIKLGIVTGIFMFLTYACATMAIHYTTASRTAFFSCLSAPCVPVLVFLFFRQKPTRRNIVSLLICAVGVYLISMSGQDGNVGMNIGDILSLCASAFTAMEIVLIDRYLGDKDSTVLSILELGAIGIFSIIAIFVSGEQSPASWTSGEIWAMIYLTLGCTALAFVLKTFGQKHVPAGRASIILTMEPVFGGIDSAILLNDKLGLRGWIGALIVVASVIISEYHADSKDESNF